MKYTYRFFYKIGFFLMCLICTGLTVTLIATATSRDNSKEYETMWRDKYIESRALLGISIRQTDLVIDQITAQEMAMWEMYCNNRDAFRVNLARKAMGTK